MIDKTVLKISFEYSRVMTAYHEICCKGNEKMAKEYLETQFTNFKIWAEAIQELGQKNESTKELLKEIKSHLPSKKNNFDLSEDDFDEVDLSKDDSDDLPDGTDYLADF